MRQALVAGAIVVLVFAQHASACLDCARKLEPAFKQHWKNKAKLLTFCSPGYFDPHTGFGLPMFCEPCGIGFFCEDGATQVKCPDGQTTSTETATSAKECFNPTPSTPPPTLPPVKPPPKPSPPTPTNPIPPIAHPPTPNPPTSKPPPSTPNPPTPNPPTSKPPPSTPNPPPATPSPPITKCNPCAESNPDVLLTTGGSASPPNGLWRVRSWSPRQDLMPEFLCALTGLQGMVADIAMRSNGDVVFVDPRCNMYLLPYATYQQLTPTRNKDKACSPKFLARLEVPEGTACTGISHGLRSNALLLSDSEGGVIEMEVSRKAGGGVVSRVVSRTVAAADPLSDRPGTDGGTDVTFAPDGNAYRFTAKDRHTEYAATRFMLDTSTGLLSGKFAYTNRGLPDAKEKYSNAGSFCTKEYAVGVAARDLGADTDYATFFSYGIGQPGNRQPSELPAMQQVAQTVSTQWSSALRVNGAATRPVCGL